MRHKLLQLLCLFHILLQILDGAFTYWGMTRFGTWAEGNPILRSAMESIGVLPTLLIAKGLGISLMLLFLKYMDDLIESFKTSLFCLLFVNLVYIYVVYGWVIIFLIFG